jgi:Histidine kinase
LVLAYSLFRWRAGRDAAIGLAIMAVAVSASVSADFPGVAETIAGTAVLLFAAALGASIRYRGVACGQLLEQAKLQEREQLARELHDTVAHHVSAIAIQAQAGLFLARSSSLSGATEALETSTAKQPELSLRCARWSAHSGTVRSSQQWSPDAALPTSNVWPRTAPTRFASTWSCAVN